MNFVHIMNVSETVFDLFMSPEMSLYMASFPGIFPWFSLHILHKNGVQDSLNSRKNDEISLPTYLHLKNVLI